jgi:hypothetical protein
MNDVPKIVHHRLRAATLAPEILNQTHPNADVLTAFTEQALAVSEREGVLQHLALCADCRGVVALALPEIETAIPAVEDATAVLPVPAKRSESWFPWATLSWAHLRWATLAAGIAVAVLVVRPGLERMGKPHTAVNSEARQLSAPAARPQSASQLASSLQPANSEAAILADKDAAKHPVEHYGRAKNGRAKEDSIAAGAPAAAGLEYSATTVKSLRADKSALSKSTIGESPTTVEVAGGAEMVSGIVSGDEAPSSEPNLMARADAPPVQNAPKIEKAKPALDETTRDAAVNGGKVNEAQTSAQTTLASPASGSSQPAVAQLAVTSKTRALKAATPLARLQAQNESWTIADGNLQRSLDGGHTWQIAARAALALLCYANRGQDVWAAGQSGTLLHSADNGATWSAIGVSFNGQALSSDVIDVKLQGPVQIVLSTSTHETWNSADAGKTWEKK